MLTQGWSTKIPVSKICKEIIKPNDFLLDIFVDRHGVNILISIFWIMFYENQYRNKQILLWHVSYLKYFFMDKLHGHRKKFVVCIIIYSYSDYFYTHFFMFFSHHYVMNNKLFNKNNPISHMHSKWHQLMTHQNIHISFNSSIAVKPC